MRLLTAVLLILLLATCPVLCGAIESSEALGCCPADGKTCPGAADHKTGDAPVPCSDDGGTCICAGAVQAADVRLDSATSWPSSAPSPILDVPLAPLHPHLGHHLTRTGAPTGWASLGNVGRIFALLQRIRR